MKRVVWQKSLPLDHQAVMVCLLRELPMHVLEARLRGVCCLRTGLPMLVDWIAAESTFFGTKTDLILRVLVYSHHHHDLLSGRDDLR